MNIDTREVYDFAGEGFVYRLLLQQDTDSQPQQMVPRMCGSELRSDGSSATTSYPQTKLVEAVDPLHRSYGRADAASGCYQDDDRVTSLSQQYSATVEQQLALQQESYDGRRAQLEKFIQEETLRTLSSLPHTVTKRLLAEYEAVANTAEGEPPRSLYSRCVTHLLARERERLLQQLRSTDEKLREVEEDSAAQQELLTALRESKRAREQMLAEREEVREETRVQYEKWFDRLEDKAALLMAKLG